MKIKKTLLTGLLMKASDKVEALGIAPHDTLFGYVMAKLAYKDFTENHEDDMLENDLVKEMILTSFAFTRTTLDCIKKQSLVLVQRAGEHLPTSEDMEQAVNGANVAVMSEAWGYFQDLLALNEGIRNEKTLDEGFLKDSARAELDRKYRKFMAEQA